MMNKLKNYFKMVKCDKLSLSEELVYSVISKYSYRGVSKISRSLISEMTGIKKLSTITKHTNRLEKLGLITKTYVGGNKKSVAYHLNYKDEPFTIVMDSLMDKLDGTELSFAIRLAGLRWKDTPWIDLNKTEIISKMKIGASTFYEYMPRLIEKDIVMEIKGCYVLNINYFPSFQKLTKETIDLIKCALDQDKEAPAHKAVKKAYEHCFIGIRNPHQYVYKCLTGEAFVKNKEKEIPETQKEYSFD